MAPKKCWMLPVEKEGVSALIISFKGPFIPSYDRPRAQGGGFVELRASATPERLGVVVPIDDELDSRFVGSNIEIWINQLQTDPDQWQEVELNALPLRQLLGVS